MSNKALIKSIVVLTLICLVCSAALAVVNGFTEPIIEAAAAERETAARQQVLAAASDFEELPLDGLDVASAFRGTDASGATVGYVFTAAGKGFNGDVVVMTAIGADGSIIQVNTMDVTAETATLGGKTADPAYTDQYKGQDASLSGVDTISGATYTCDGYEEAVAKAFAAYDAVKEG